MGNRSSAASSLSPPPDTNEVVAENLSRLMRLNIFEGDEEDDEEETGEAETPEECPRLVGDPVRVWGNGKDKRKLYESFTFGGNTFFVDDPVLIAPAEGEPNQKPRLAIIKGIAETTEKKVIVSAQMFYRPEEAQRRTLGCWKSRFKGELFYSFHREDFPAEGVMHKFVVHFIPQNKQIPLRKDHPGMVVQKIYDRENKRLYNITDNNYGRRRRAEINILVEKTKARLGDLPDIVEPEDATSDQENHNQNRRCLAFYGAPDHSS